MISEALARPVAGSTSVPPPPITLKVTGAPGTGKPASSVTRTLKGFGSGSSTVPSWKSVVSNFWRKATLPGCAAGDSDWRHTTSTMLAGMSVTAGAVTPPEWPPCSCQADSPVPGSRIR